MAQQCHAACRSIVRCTELFFLVMRVWAETSQPLDQTQAHGLIGLSSVSANSTVIHVIVRNTLVHIHGWICYIDDDESNLCNAFINGWWLLTSLNKKILASFLDWNTDTWPSVHPRGLLFLFFILILSIMWFFGKDSVLESYNYSWAAAKCADYSYILISIRLCEGRVTWSYTLLNVNHSNKCGEVWLSGPVVFAMIQVWHIC